MKKLKFWHFAIIIVVGFTVGAVGTTWFTSGPPEDAGSESLVPIAEADFQLPEFPDDMFTPQKAVYEGDKLVLTLRSNVLHAEPLEEVTFSKESEQGTVSFRSVADGEFDVIVTDPPADIDNAVLDLPAVSIEHMASISVSLDSETFTGPGDATYTFTYRSSNSDSGTLRLRIDYEPNDPSAPSISDAYIQAGGESINAIRAGGKFDSLNRFKFGRLVFPIEAQALTERDGAELMITQYSKVVKDSIVMPAGLVSADDRLATSTSPAGTH